MSLDETVCWRLDRTAVGTAMNAINAIGTMTAFSSSIFSLLERVEYRRIQSIEDFQNVSELRNVSYQSKQFIDLSAFGALIDDEDFSDHCRVVGVYIDEQLVSTIRLHLVTPNDRNGPTYEYFPDIANRILDAGQSYIDPSRFASDPLMLWQYPTIPLLTLRPAAMASIYFNVEHCMSCVRADSASFYGRSFGSAELAAARNINGFTVPLCVMGAKIADIRERLETRFPFFKSQPYEQRMMFGKIEDLAYPPMNILPSAKYANQIRR